MVIGGATGGTTGTGGSVVGSTGSGAVDGMDPAPLPFTWNVLVREASTSVSSPPGREIVSPTAVSGWSSGTRSGMVSVKTRAARAEPRW